MIIDITKCSGCYNCFLACRDEFCGNDYPGYSVAQPYSGQFWMKILERERGRYPKVKVAYTPIPCMQCENAPCIEASLDGAVYRRADSMVILDPAKAQGQKQILRVWMRTRTIRSRLNIVATVLRGQRSRPALMPIWVRYCQAKQRQKTDSTWFVG